MSMREEPLSHTASKSGVPTYIGIDIGGTKIDAALVDSGGRVLRALEVPTRKGNDGITEDVCALSSQLIEGSNALETPAIPSTGTTLSSHTTPLAIGIGIPGIVDPKSGTVRNALNLEIEDFNLQESVEQHMNIPVHVENDVNAVALAADSLLTGGHGTTVFINFGTGIAAGLVADGRILSGANGCLGEIGHIPMDPHGLPCSCGQNGCLETVASGSGIVRRWPTKAQYPIKEIFDYSNKGNKTASHIIDGLVFGITKAIQLVAQTFDPDQIAIGGGVLGIGEPLRKRVDAELARIESSSEFLASLDVSNRLTFMSSKQHIGAVGAALAALPTD
jgi:predicted NBD/HSP70 family sugar kinase